MPRNRKIKTRKLSLQDIAPKLPFRYILSIDTETTGLRPWLGDRPFAFGFHLVDIIEQTEKEYYWRWPVSPDRQVEPVFQDIVEMQDLMNSVDRCVFFNAKFDIRMMEQSGFRMPSYIDEVTFRIKALQSELPSVKLKPLSHKLLGIPETDEQDLKNQVKKARAEAKGKGWKIAKDVEADYWLPGDLHGDDSKCKKYCLQDVVRTSALYLFTEVEFYADSISHDVYKREMKLFPVVYQIEERGVRTFPKTLNDKAQELQNQKDEWTSTIHQWTGNDLNPRSGKQVAEYLHDRLKLPVIQTTDKGAPSTSADALQALKQYLDINMAWEPNSFRACIVLDSLVSLKKADTYAKYLAQYKSHMISEKDYWVIHGLFNQYGAGTGRFSASEPNLQNVDDLLRECFGPRPGYYWVLIDWNQIEMRIFAQLSQDPALLKACRTGEDIYMWTARQAWGDHSDDKVMAARRKQAKAIALGKIYGLGVDKAMEMAGYEQGAELIQKFDTEFPGIGDYLAKSSSYAIQNGYVRTLKGRRVGVPAKLAYKSVNAEDQGTAADLLKSAMIRTERVCRKFNARIVLTIHDELVFEIPDAVEPDEIIPKLARRMSKTGLDVPTPVSVKMTRQTWAKKDQTDYVLPVR